MSNTCFGRIRVRGTPNNVKRFKNALTQANSDCWLGRGFLVEKEEYENEKTVDFYGYCSNSFQSALFDDAESMRKQKLSGNGYWEDGVYDISEFLTVFEACKRFNVNIEAYSIEPDNGFSEYLKYENGKTLKEVDVYVVAYKNAMEFLEEKGFTVKAPLSIK